MTDLEIMRAARALITAPGSWTQNAFARDARGRHVFTEEKSVTCFCSIGALHKARASEAGIDMFYAHIDEKYNCSVATWNDDPARTHKEVLAEFDEVIAKLEATQ